MDVQQDTSALAHEQTSQEHGPIKVASLTETVREAMSTTLDDESCPTTPTRHSFAGIAGQKPLPEPTFTPTHPNLVLEINTSSPNGAASETSYKSEPENQDVEMGEADDVEEGAEDDGTDNDSVTSESQRPSKKKKGQRFFCTEYPPCQLSFTRSEHLARHIRKHTGERPFQCHCSRRFSRLDNLRQHAQTVHVNEDIPGDSLAATSTRFQRQIRTDRVRPSSSRSRASTIGSQGGHSRGHSRNLSASSIGSTASSIGVPEDVRRRPQPLAMANEGPAGRGRLSLDTFSGVNIQPGPPAPQYYNQSPGGYSTPTSTAFSTGASSPHFQSGLASPTSTISHSSYYNGGRPVSRRLSVPAENNPYRNHAPIYAPGYFSPASSTTSGVYTQNSSGFASPTSSVHSYARRDSETETEYRRRTWHPSSNSQHAQRPATSGLSYYQTPDQPQPAFSQQAVTASQPTRLPGIESFEFGTSGSAARPNMSPMVETASPRPPTAARPVDSVLNHGLTKLEITPGDHEQRWPVAPNAPPAHAGPQAPSHQAPPASYAAAHHISMPEQPVTPRKNKRNAWYGGPLAPPAPPHVSHFLQRPSPEDSSSSEGVPTPSTSQGTEYNPMIYSSSHPLAEMLPPGAILTEEQKTYYNVVQPKPDPVRADSGYQGSAVPYGAPSHTYAVQAGHDHRAVAANYGQQPPQNDMTKLEALVAVATSEGNRAVEHR